MKHVLVTLLFAASVSSGFATVTHAGHAFAGDWSTNGASLKLHNTALLKVGLVFKVYVAGLYLSDPADAKRVLEDVPKRLEIVYLRDLEARVLIDAADDYLKKNHTAVEIATIKSRLDDINKLYADVKEGDRYTLTYLPGTGSELALNGKPLGTIPGADFAKMYFGIWLGPGCVKPDFRNALLKTADPAG